MQDIGCKLSRTAAVVVIFLAVCAGSAWAGGVPWQVGDIVVCYGGGKCNVIRLHGNAVQVLDTISDANINGLGGNNRGVGLNNTLHVVATDDNGGGSSNVVVYSIASVNPFNPSVPPLTHNVINTYNGTGNSGDSAAAVAVSSGGHIFVGNSNATGASIVELSANGTATGNVFTFPTAGSCATTTINSIDIGATADFIYVTAGDGIIRKVGLPLSASSACSPFANFGSLVNLYGVKDIPAGALSGTCGSNPPNNPPSACPSGESVLVVAKGFTDPDAAESSENPSPGDSDAVNICTNATDQTLVSCGLLLDTNVSPGLNAPLWNAGTSYGLTDKILDPSLHVQRVVTAGTSGGQEPAFDEGGLIVMDNAVIWTDKGQPQRIADTSYTQTAFPGTYVVDSNLNLQTVTTSGTSSHDLQPNWQAPGTTVDGLQWQDQGAWQANHTFALGAAVGDSSGHPHTVLTSGTSGPGAQPAGGWNDSGGNNGGLTGNGVTIDNAVIWTNEGAVTTWGPGTPFGLNTFIAPNGHIQQAVEPGTSGGGTPAFSTSGGRTIDNAVTWADLGPDTWLPSFNYGLSAIIVDGSGNVQQVTTAGTSGPGPQPTFSATTTTDGLQWSLVQPNATAGQHPDWQANTFYCSCPGGTAPFFQYPPTGDIWQAVTFGTSGSTEPTFYAPDHVTPITPQPIADNAVVWTSEGPKSGFAWTANHGYAVNVQIVDPGNHVQLVSVAGTSGPNPPTFQDGGPTVDGTAETAVTWTNLGMAVWRPTFSYGLNAIIVDPAGNVQQATTGGTTASTQPPFNATQGVTTPDGTVTWTNEGPLSGNPTFTWHSGTPYNLNAMIVDAANQIELATTAGTSATSNNPPTFADGSNVVDGLVWLDIGPVLTWTPNATYTATVAAPFTLVIGNGFVQQATTTGNAGASSPPSWNVTIGGKTVDGLQWNDYGPSTWAANTHYWTLNALISDSNTHAQKVVQTGTSGPVQAAPTFGTNGETINDNAVIWTESKPSWQMNHKYVVGNTDTLILDSHSHVQLVTTSGTSGPTTPPFTSDKPVTGQTIDGLQWQVQTTPSTSVIARYPAPAGVTGLQSLALDPLVSNCTGGNPAGTACSTGSLPTRIVTDSNLVPNTNQAVSPSFWMGDNGGSGNIYTQNFAGGVPATIPGVCSSCHIQSLVVYGGESANQPGLASLVLNGSLTSSANTAKANFLGNSILSTLSNNNGSALTGSTAISLYGSAVDPASCFNDPSAGSIGCQPFSNNPAQAFVLKLDIPLNGTAALPSTQTLNTAITPPAGTFDNGTDVFVDEQFDDTTFVGGDPGTRTVSVHSLHEVPFQFNQGQSQCTYSSPLQNGCYKTNRSTLNFIFTCTGLTQTQFQNLKPVLSLVKKHSGQAPLFIPLQGTNGKGPYRFNATQNFWTFQWSLNGATAGTYQGTTFDNSGTVQSFPVTFNLKTSCP